jgi:hypothetical protein
MNGCAPSEMMVLLFLECPDDEVFGQIRPVMPGLRGSATCPYQRFTNFVLVRNKNKQKATSQRLSYQHPGPTPGSGVFYSYSD